MDSLFCTFDPFKLGLPVYIAWSKCLRTLTAESIMTERTKCSINCPAWQKCSDKEMQAFLKLFLGLEAETEYTRQIVHQMRTSLNREDVRRRVMRLQDIVEQRVEQMIEERLEQRVEENKMLWLAQGDIQGFDRDSREKARETARRALECGIPADTVSKFTGLSIDEVKTLL